MRTVRKLRHWANTSVTRSLQPHLAILEGGKLGDPRTTDSPIINRKDSFNELQSNFV